MTIWNSVRLLTHAIIVVTTLAGASAIAAPVARDWKAIRIGIDAVNPSLGSTDFDQVQGSFDVAIAKTLCDRLKARCDFVPAVRSALLTDLLTHKSDAVIASVAITDETRKIVDFTDKYYSMSARFAVARASGLAAISPEAMRGKSIGAIEGTPYATYLTEIYGSKGVSVKLYKSGAEAHAALRDGHLSAVFGSSIGLYRWIDDGAGGRCCHFVGPDIRNSKILGDGAGIAVRREDGDLRDMFNRALADILRDGTYEKVNAMYFNFLVY